MMPRIIVTSRYMRNSPKRTAANLVKYMGTRKGVEKMAEGWNPSPVTVRQQRLIGDILKAAPEAEQYPEYSDFLKTPSKGAALEFINSFIERNADRAEGVKSLVKYMAERPGVGKLGSHGLFSQTDDKIDLRAVAEEVGAHEGIIWTHVVSLKREDAERLGYNRAEAWKELTRRSVAEIANAHGISLSNLQWYAAFHNTTYHPHMHLLVYAKDAQQGWLKKNGIGVLRSTFGNDIFRNEQYKLFSMETELRDRLKEEVKEDISELAARIRDSYMPSQQTEALFLKLSQELRTCKGKKTYGYLPREVKRTVDEIVAELAKDKDIAALYEEWNKVNREKLSLYYDKKKPDIPLEDNKEFRSIKNEIIRAAVFGGSISIENSAPSVSASVVRGLASSLARLIAESTSKHLTRLNAQVDGKLRAKIEQKKAAHGLRTDHTVQQFSGAEEPTMQM